jgi:hypothetical protein
MREHYAIIELCHSIALICRQFVHPKTTTTNHKRTLFIDSLLIGSNSEFGGFRNRKGLITKKIFHHSLDSGTILFTRILAIDLMVGDNIVCFLPLEWLDGFSISRSIHEHILLQGRKCDARDFEMIHIPLCAQSIAFSKQNSPLGSFSSSISHCWVSISAPERPRRPAQLLAACIFLSSSG